VVPLFGLAALLLVPWVVLLVFLLPSAHQAAHWDIAWAGFDVMLALLLSAVAIAAWRGSLWFEGAAVAAAALLFVDAWFDILTSSTRLELFVALAEAVLIELPLAFLCLLLARDAERRLRMPLLNRSEPAESRSRARFEGAPDMQPGDGETPSGAREGRPFRRQRSAGAARASVREPRATR
jgi:hypothetical protein